MKDLRILFISAYLFCFAAILEANTFVPATSDLWLSGMPDGTRASGIETDPTGEDSDIAPAYSPAKCTEVPILPGGIYEFRAAGRVMTDSRISFSYPDGASQIVYHAAHAQNGIADVTAPANALMGIFLSDERPDLSEAAAPLNFSSAASREYIQLYPLLKQPFFIGDGITASSYNQKIFAPAGATRLFLGTMDSYGWYDNMGSYDVQVSFRIPAPPVADAGLDQTVTDIDDNGSEEVILDGSHSYDPNGSIAGFVWTEDDNQIAAGSKPVVTLAVGTHIITLTVTDIDNLTDSNTVTITVKPFTYWPGSAQKYKVTILSGKGCGDTFSVATGIRGNQIVGMGNLRLARNSGFIWDIKEANYAALSAARFHESQVWATNGKQQVGGGFYQLQTGDYSHALLWNGDSNSFVDLNPAECRESFAQGISGKFQIGWGRDPNTGSMHALLWKGTAESVIDLTPAGFTDCYGNGIDGRCQVGYGRDMNTWTLHALLWKGTAEKFTDLNPPGYDYSVAYGIKGKQQVGYCFSSGNSHALLWKGSANSAIDLNPNGFVSSTAFGTNGTQQVGCGTDKKGNTRALVWSGSGDKFIDLSKFLPSDNYTFRNSYAYGIDSRGGIVGYAYDGSIPCAILWQPVDPIKEILKFINESIEDGNLMPARNGLLGRCQLDIFICMVRSAGRKIKDGDIEAACGQLNAALGKTDGQKQPPDFVTGIASVELAQKIRELIADLEQK